MNRRAWASSISASSTMVRNLLRNLLLVLVASAFVHGTPTNRSKTSLKAKATKARRDLAKVKRSVKGGRYSTSEQRVRKGQGTPAVPVNGGETATANNGQHSPRSIAGGKFGEEDATKCDPPNSVLKDGRCEYHCHPTALPSNDTRHTCVCGAHYDADGLDDSGRIKCVRMGSSNDFSKTSGTVIANS